MGRGQCVLIPSSDQACECWLLFETVLSRPVVRAVSRSQPLFPMVLVPGALPLTRIPLIAGFCPFSPHLLPTLRMGKLREIRVSPTCHTEEFLLKKIHFFIFFKALL